MSTIVSNPKLSMSSSKISLDIIERFFILTIDNKHARSAPILQSILRTSVNSIDVPSHSFCQEIENPDINNKNDESEIETRIEFEDEIN